MYGSSDDHQQSTDEHRGPASNAIAEIWCEGVARESAYVLLRWPGIANSDASELLFNEALTHLDGAEEPEFSLGREVEIVFPLR